MKKPPDGGYAHSLDHYHRLYCRSDLAPGDEPYEPILTTVLGIVGALVATNLGQAIGWYGPDQSAGLIGGAMWAQCSSCWFGDLSSGVAARNCMDRVSGLR
jgi:hypothetical protein